MDSDAGCATSPTMSAPKSTPAMSAPKSTPTMSMLMDQPLTLGTPLSSALFTPINDTTKSPYSSAPGSPICMESYTDLDPLDTSEPSGSPDSSAFIDAELTDTDVSCVSDPHTIDMHSVLISSKRLQFLEYIEKNAERLIQQEVSRHYAP